MQKSRVLAGVLTLAAGLVFSSSGRSDEGMWLFNQLPTEKLKKQYGFDPSQAWTDHVMKASVRFNDGGSGSFISPTGLIITNHHVAADTLHKVSDKNHDYYKNGFYATTLDKEIPAPDLEIDALISIEDVTDRVMSVVTPGMAPADALVAKKNMMSQIEKESEQKTGLRSDVVTLFNGGKYNLYRYKVYTDIRVVFAPEFAIAFFGGDPDNFEYPRYDLDMAIFRAYENGSPVKIQDYFQWSTTGAQDGELIFVSGNPGSTDRLDTLSELEAIRDFSIPFTLNWLLRQEQFLSEFGATGPEQERWSKDDFFGVQNSRKVYKGELASLQDPNFLQIKAKQEADLRRAVASKPELQATLAAWDQIADAEAVLVKIGKKFSLIEGKAKTNPPFSFNPGRGLNSVLYKYAQVLVRLAQENPKANENRLPEYRDSNRKALEQELYSTAPIYPDYEKATLAESLSYMATELGIEDPLMKKILAGKSPIDRANDLVDATGMTEPSIRKQIATGGANAIANSRDSMIQLALIVDPAARELRKKYEDQVLAPKDDAYGKIANAMFTVYGTSTYPNATFTPRLAFGSVKGYTIAGAQIPSMTQMGGAFDHELEHGAKDPFELPPSWHQYKDQLDLTTPMNFVADADIIGGNSGSPVLNKNAEFVGLIFDGNIQSLAGAYLFDAKINRAVAVHSKGMLEAMRKIYHVDPLIDEILGTKKALK